MPEKTTDVVVAGHLCLDVFPAFAPGGARPDFGELFRPGKLTEVGAATMHCGGVVANTGLALKILGMKVDLQGKTGDDHFARILRAQLASRGADDSIARGAGEQTSYTVVLAPGGVDRMFLHCPGANATFGPEDVCYERVARARLFHFGYPPLMRRMVADGGAALLEMFRRVRKLPGVATSLDMALPDPTSQAGRADWRGILEAVLPEVDFFVPSLEEAWFMLDPAEFLARREEAHRAGRSVADRATWEHVSALGEQLSGFGARVVLIKCGAKGLYARTSGARAMGRIPGLTPEQKKSWSRRELCHAVYRVERFGSATGAGDCTIAGFLAAFLRGAGLEETLDIACALGACNVTALDALSGLCSWEETRARLAAGWPTRPVEIPSRPWRERIPATLWEKSP